MEFVIAGLGNPGAEYESTRHNAGFYFADVLAEELQAGGWREKWQGLQCDASFKGHKIHFVKPQTYMNRSGLSVAQYCNFFKIAPERLVVMHDDLDMPPARIKFVRGGGDGGHNGIKSLVQSLGYRDFFRLKVGIGRPGQGDVHPQFPVEKYVLSAFGEEEYTLMAKRKEPVVAGFSLFFAGELARAVGVFNSLKGQR